MLGTQDGVFRENSAHSIFGQSRPTRLRTYVRLWLLADIQPDDCDVRYWYESGHPDGMAITSFPPTTIGPQPGPTWLQIRKTQKNISGIGVPSFSVGPYRLSSPPAFICGDGLSLSFVLIHFVPTFPKCPLKLGPMLAEDDASVKVGTSVWPYGIGFG